MTGQVSERPDKGKGVARPKKRQRHAPKYVLRVPAKLPTIVACIHPSPTLAVHPSITPTADPLPPLVIITPTPPPVVITPTPLLDPTSIPSSSCIPPSKTVTPSADPDSSGGGEGLDLPLHG
ncbi:endoglucanase A-like [Vigna umbellata]|uniref:endoglucanase A-like n=1 Tax=Vigna umbellata TaxID=87088 RepID=UPI001F5E3892|nr:endoglucanase A-like [Vigna umbellata]